MFSVSSTLENRFTNRPTKREGEVKIVGGAGNDDIDKPFQCGLCGSLFSLQADLGVHVQQHACPFQCGFCDASFDTKLLLITHVNAHNFFMCTERNETIKETAAKIHSRQDLKQAVEFQSETLMTETPDDDDQESVVDAIDRPKVCLGRKRKAAKPLHFATGPDDLLVCPTCGRRFHLQVDLKRHSTDEHGDDRPFQCTQCPSRFKQNIHLTDHMNSVHRVNKPHICPMCGDNFKLVGYLRLHIKRVHRVDPFSVVGRRSRKRCDSSLESDKRSAKNVVSKQDSVEGKKGGDDDTIVRDADADAEHFHDPVQKTTEVTSSMQSQTPAGDDSSEVTDASTEWDFIIHENGSRIEIVVTRSGKTAHQQDEAGEHNTAATVNPNSSSAKPNGTGFQQDPSEDSKPVVQRAGAVPCSQNLQTLRWDSQDDRSDQNTASIPIVSEEVVSPSAAGEQSDGNEQKVETAKTGKPFKCGECQMHFASTVTLRDHWKSTHNVCDCGDVFVEPLEMYDHRYSVHGEVKCKKNYKPYMCALCGAGFRVVNYLRDHIDKLHWKRSGKRQNVVGAKLFKCPVCSKTFPYLSWYARHCEATHGLSPNVAASAVQHS